MWIICNEIIWRCIKESYCIIPECYKIFIKYVSIVCVFTYTYIHITHLAYKKFKL